VVIEAAVPTTFRSSLTSLAQAQKSNKGAPAYSRLVNRPLGRVLAAAANTLGMSPNHVTLVSATCTFSALAVLVLTRSTPLVALLVAVLLVVGYALDAADGQLARLQGSSSPAGEWLDHVVDACKGPALHIAVLVNWYRFEDVPTAQLLLPVCFQAVASVTFFVIILNDLLRRLHPQQADARPRAHSSSVLYSLAVAPADYGMLCLVFVLGGWHTGFVVAYGIVFASTAALLVVGLPKWLGQIRTLR
jgi:phosphatidylglycerophosphate synthase